MNDKRQGFDQLADLIVKGKVNKFIIKHKDRLTQFQFNFIKRMYAVFGCKIYVQYLIVYMMIGYQTLRINDRQM